MLSRYRVLDLTTERGLLCGQILADLGADVIKIEPPGGSPARQLAPFFEDRPDRDRSIYWWSYNRNKRSITLDIETDDGRALLYRLAARAQFLIESYDPGYLSDRELGYEDVATHNREIIYVSITPFGQAGPKASYADSDLVILAAGGPLLLCGDEDRAPIRVSIAQAYLHACGDAAVGALVANHERQRSGMGQQVDVSAQQSVTPATQANNLAFRLDADEARRMAGGVRVGSMRVPLVWRAKDGYVTLLFLFGRQLGVFTKRLMTYLYEQEACDAATRDKDWIEYGSLLAGGQEPMQEYTRIVAIIADFVSTRTKADLFADALERGLLIAPIATVSDVLSSPQLKARHYWQALEHPELARTFSYPGPFAKFSEVPIVYHRRPPLVGEHNREIYCEELGLSESEIQDLTRRGII